MKKNVSYNIVVLGNSAVGKTTIIKTWINQKKFKNPLPTIGVDIHLNKIYYRQKKIFTFIWDMSGHQRFINITRSHLNNKDGIIIMFDKGDRTTFLDLDFWLKIVKSQENYSPIICLVGINWENNSQVTKEEAINYAELNCLSYQEIKGHNIKDIDKFFKRIIDSNWNKITSKKEKKSEKKNCFKKLWSKIQRYRCW